MKKIIALFLMLTMVLSLFTVMAGAVTLPNGEEMEAPYEDGTDHEGWIAVGTADEFEEIVAGKKYYLTADIDLTGIDESKKAVIKGGGGSAGALVIDGRGYTLTTDRPIIAQLPDDGKDSSIIMNLVIDTKDGAIIETKAAYFDSKDTSESGGYSAEGWYDNGIAIGVLVGKANGGTIKNVVNKASVTQVDNMAARAGGIVGSAFNGSLTIENCRNEGDIVAYGSNSYASAGILGYAGVTDELSVVTIKNCENTGDITVNIGYAWNSTDKAYNTVATKTYAAGILGYENSTCRVLVVDNENTGVITAETASDDLCAYELGNDLSTTLEELTADNFASLTGNGAYYLSGNIEINETNTNNSFTGYIIGNGNTITASVPLFDALTDATICDLVIDTTIAIDAADIEAVTYNESKGYTGYFAGALANYATACVIKNVDVTGSIDVGTADAGVTVKTGVGSIAGLMDASQAADCDNSAAITVYNSGASIQVSVGGMAGALDGESVLDNCTNGEKLYGQYGTGYGSSSYVFVGGMAGVTNLAGSTSNDDKITIKNCTNTGVIDAERSGGGMIGRCNSSTAKHTYTNNTNTGAVSGNYAAGHIGYTYVIGTFKNCSNSGVITSKTDAAGGIIGMSNGSDEITFENCANNATGTIAATTYGGGILGCAYSVKATFTGCSNSASVTSTSNYAGGIVGLGGNSNYPSIALTFESCTNNATGTITGKTYAGGIVADIYTATDGAATFTNCKNEGDVTATSQRAGGIVANATVKGAFTFSKCENHGDVTTNTKKQVGGIAGYINSGYTSLAFTDCGNYGAITANGASNDASAGGIAGVVAGAGCEFKNCVNGADGIITAEGRSAGIVAWASGTSYTFTNCANYANITSKTASLSGSYAGGIVGVSTIITATGCYNEGDVSSYLAAGGIAGVVGKASTIKYCLNKGNITTNVSTVATMARNGAAGIIGCADVALDVQYCGSMGSIMNNNDRTGTNCTGSAGIVMSKVSTTTVSNCFVTVDPAVVEGAETVVVYDVSNATVSDCYVLGDTLEAEQLTNGSLAYIMQGDGSDEKNTWGQLLDGSDDHPVLNAAKVFKATNSNVYYNDFVNANLNLDQALTMNAYANIIVLDDTKLSAKFTMNGSTVDDDFDSFATYNSIAPQCINEEITIEIYAGDEKIIDEVTTVVAYLEDLVVAYPEYTDVAKALVRYGYEAHNYLTAKDSYIIEGIDAVASKTLLKTGDMKAAVDNAPMSLVKNNAYTGNFSFAAAGVSFDSVNRLYFKVNVPAAEFDNATVTIDGADAVLEAVSNGVYVVYSNDIMASQFGDQVVVVLSDNGTEVATLTYGINNYACRMQTNELGGALALATYHYGVAAAALK